MEKLLIYSIVLIAIIYFILSPKRFSN